MKLKPIKKEHILQSADFIDQDGIPNNYLHNNYWVKIPGNKEYPFKHLIREAYRIATGK